jgi:hypothetical protein
MNWRRMNWRNKKFQSRIFRWGLCGGLMFLVLGAAQPGWAWQFGSGGSRPGPGQWNRGSHPRSMVSHPGVGRGFPGSPACGWRTPMGGWGHRGILHRHYPVHHFGHRFQPCWPVGGGWGAPHFPRAFRTHLFVGYSRRVIHPFYPVFPAFPLSPVIVCPPVFVPFYPMIGTSLWVSAARPVLPARLVLGDIGLPDAVLTDELAALVAARRADLAARAASGLRGDEEGIPVVRIGASYDADRSLRAGDTAFRAKRYGNATEFYRLAMTREGGSHSPGHLRAAYALVAQSRYREAHHEFTLAMKTLGQDGSLSFQLDSLYADESEKIEHLEQLAKASWQKPRDSHLQTLIGLFLWHDGQTQRAKTFLLAAQRASEGQDQLSAQLLNHVDPVRVARR